MKYLIFIFIILFSGCTTFEKVTGLKYHPENVWSAEEFARAVNPLNWHEDRVPFSLEDDVRLATELGLDTKDHRYNIRQLHANQQRRLREAKNDRGGIRYGKTTHLSNGKTMTVFSSFRMGSHLSRNPQWKTRQYYDRGLGVWRDYKNEDDYNHDLREGIQSLHK